MIDEKDMFITHSNMLAGNKTLKFTAILSMSAPEFSLFTVPAVSTHRMFSQRREKALHNADRCKCLSVKDNQVPYIRVT